MEKTAIKNIVIFKPISSVFCHSYKSRCKKITAEHLDGESFLTFEFNGNRIESFDETQKPCMSVETDPITETTSLSLRDNKPVVIIHGKTTLFSYAIRNSPDPYITEPAISGHVDGSKIRFQPVFSNNSDHNKIIHRYNVIDDQFGATLGILLLPANSLEMTVAFEECATETQKQLIIGVSTFIIGDRFRANQNQIYALLIGIFIIFMVASYLFILTTCSLEE